jgi:hypothetical protein
VPDNVTDPPSANEVFDSVDDTAVRTPTDRSALVPPMYDVEPA